MPARALWFLAPCLLAGCGVGSAEDVAAFQGVVEFDETALSFETPGKLARVGVKEGDSVIPGAEIAALDDTLGKTARDARAREVAALRAQVALAEKGARREDIAALAARARAAAAVEELLTKQVARQRGLKAQGASTDAMMDELEGQLARARAEREAYDMQLAAAKSGTRPEEKETIIARAEAAEAALKLEEERLARHVLRADRAGRVLDVFGEPGEVVGAGTPIATLADTKHPFVDIFVPQAQIGGVRLGARAAVRVDSSAAPVGGSVEHIARSTEFTPRFLFSDRERPNLVIRVRVRLNDAEERVHAGLPAFVTLDRGGNAP